MRLTATVHFQPFTMKYTLLLSFALIVIAKTLAGTIQQVPKQKNNHPIKVTKNDAINDEKDRQMHQDDVPHLETRAQTPLENESRFWMESGLDFVDSKLNTRTNRKRAKNVIIFLGDGMSTTTMAAARPYIHSEETFLSWERFPVVGSVKTYCVDAQVADSACTATAYLAGVKANTGTLGLTANVSRYSCTGQLDKENHVTSIAQWAIDAGKVAGLVTTAGVTAASPAGLYAHSAERYWENDNAVKKVCSDPSSKIEDIASQLINGDLGSQFRVILGGRRADFRPTTFVDEEGVAGLRGDGRDLVNEWLAKKKSSNSAYVWNATELRSLNLNDVDYLLGLFEADALQYNIDVQLAKSQDKEPALHEMTRAAIEVLRKNDEGFFLFVEGDNIDQAHHHSYARLALDETAELSKAVEVARAMLPEDDTLIVVTSDHSHTMTYSGYPSRGADVTGLVGSTGRDGMPFLTLSYANGLGYENQMGPNGRIDPETFERNKPGFRYPGTIPFMGETHAGDDVLVYASGPWSHLFTGTYEQNAIPIMMAYAACLNGLNHESCSGYAGHS